MIIMMIVVMIMMIITDYAGNWVFCERNSILKSHSVRTNRTSCTIIINAIILGIITIFVIILISDDDKHGDDTEYDLYEKAA